MKYTRSSIDSRDDVALERGVPVGRLQHLCKADGGVGGVIQRQLLPERGGDAREQRGDADGGVEGGDAAREELLLHPQDADVLERGKERGPRHDQREREAGRQGGVDEGGEGLAVREGKVVAVDVVGGVEQAELQDGEGGEGGGAVDDQAGIADEIDERLGWPCG